MQHVISSRYGIHSERGQVLVLFTLSLTVLLLMMMLVFDVSFFLHKRAQAQQTADAAALAAAQELPEKPNVAREVALDYVERNGLNPDDVEITFRCTSGVTAICDESENRYDTIVVTPSAQAPSFFGGVLRVVGVNGSCWIDGCTVQASAAGCRGACGPIGNAPVDAVMVLDHSGSMSSNELQNAKDAMLELMSEFNPSLQRVGLGVTPPVDPDDLCDSINDWDDEQVWLAAGLASNFQSSDGVLNNGSGPVKYTKCMDSTGGGWNNSELPGYHTNIGSAIDGATTELATNGRADVTRGIILLTDGAANKMPDNGAFTTDLNCTVAAAVTSSSGDNNGFERNTSGACFSGGNYAEDRNSGTNSSTDCGSNRKDRTDFYNFDITDQVPSGATIEGISVSLDAYANGNNNTTRRMCVELSWNGGQSWTNEREINLDNNWSTEHLGGDDDTWGRDWTRNNLKNNNFRIRITNVSNKTSTDFYMDSLSVRVAYTAGASYLGPCDYAAQKANEAKALGLEIYAIAFGAEDSCVWDDPWSDYYGMSAIDFLHELASGDDHFFEEPKSSDLTPIFQAIGSQLTSGSKLVQ